MFIINRIVRQKRLAKSLTREDEKSKPMSEERIGRQHSSRRIKTEPIKLEINLTDLQKKALRITWRRINSCEQGSAIPLMEEVFKRVCQKSRIAAEIFYKVSFVNGLLPVKSQSNENTATIRCHAKLMTDLIDSIIFNLDREAHGLTASDQPTRIGSLHAPLCRYGFMAELWEVFGQILSETILSQDCVQAYPNGKKAWVALVACLTDTMRADFEKQISKERRVKSQSCKYNASTSQCNETSAGEKLTTRTFMRQISHSL